MCSSGSLRWLWQLDRKAFLFSCSLRPELCQAWALQQPVQVFRATGKKYPLGHWTGFLHKPSWPICLPNTTLPPIRPNQTHCPRPQVSLQLYYKQIYLSNFQTFGSKTTLGQLSWGRVGMLVLHTAVDRAQPRKSSALYIKSQSKTIH